MKAAAFVFLLLVVSSTSLDYYEELASAVHQSSTMITECDPFYHAVSCLLLPAFLDLATLHVNQSIPLVSIVSDMTSICLQFERLCGATSTSTPFHPSE
jgi:hypothetical protein